MWKPEAMGSIFDADHPKNGVTIPRLFTRDDQSGARVKSRAFVACAAGILGLRKSGVARIISLDQTQ
jgi:hypothetical protein